MEREGSLRGCFAILVFFLSVAGTVWLIRPQAQDRQEPVRPLLEVETLTLEARPYTLQIESYGTVRPKIRSALTAQVGGQILAVHSDAREGGFFESGQTLFSIDPRDFEAEVDIAEATLMDARQALAEAEARSRQAEEDWQRLGEGDEASPLVLRLPQLQAAEARVKSARAGLEKARLDLQRTSIVGPYPGRVLTQHVDLGQVVSPGTLVADIYATETAEVRLPLRSRDLPYIDLPEPNGASSGSEARKLILRSELSGPGTWEATLVRTEGAIDQVARQLHVIAEIPKPFQVTAPSRPPLKIGQYVTAEIPGTTIEGAIVIPTAAIYQGSFVYVVENDLLQRRDLSISWQNDRDAVISSGLEAGDTLVVTTLGRVTSGLRVRVLEDDRTGDETDSTRDGEP